MRRKILALLMAAGMMVLGMAGCGQTEGNRDAGDQAQGNGQTEKTASPVRRTVGSLHHHRRITVFRLRTVREALSLIIPEYRWFI